MKVEIGNATLYLGDCMDILPTLPKVDAVITDPPYLIHAGKGGGAFGNRSHLVDTGGFTDDGVNYEFLCNFENWFVFCSRLQLPDLLEIATKKQRWNLITWAKPNPVPTCNNKYLPDVEYVVHGFGKGGLHGEMKDKQSFFLENSGQKITSHPNEKPILLMEKLVRLGALDEEIILDPFMGSGTTGVAAIQLGRKFIGIERESKYFDIACKRIEQAVAQGQLFAPEHPKQIQETFL
jgi:DNA modification methylase